MLRVLVAEDDQVTGRYLKKIIEKSTNATVVAIAGNGQEVLTLSDIYLPQVVWLDIDMPGINGIEAARQLLPKYPQTSFVFCTAYPDHALEAFEVYAVDYIVKPINEQRVKETIRRLYEKYYCPQTPPDKPAAELWLDLGSQHILINPREIIYIENRKPKLLVKTKRDIYFVKGQLKTFEYKLSALGFFRCHRGYLVNLQQVNKIVPYGYTYELILRSGDSILLSRRRKKALLDKMKNITIN